MFYYILGEKTNLPYFCVGGATGIGKTMVFGDYTDGFFTKEGIMFVEVDEKSHCSLLRRKSFKSLIAHLEEVHGWYIKNQGIKAVCLVGHMRREDVCAYIFSSEPDLHLRLSRERFSEVDESWINPYGNTGRESFDVFREGYFWVEWLIKRIKESLNG